MTVRPEDYMGLLVDHCMLKVNAVIKIKETKQSWSGEDDFIMDKPKLKIGVIHNFYFILINSSPNRNLKIKFREWCKIKHACIFSDC